MTLFKTLQVNEEKARGDEVQVKNEKIYVQNWILPKLCVSLVVLFMVAQLILITALGVGFKGSRTLAVADKHVTKIVKLKMPPRRQSTRMVSSSTVPTAHEGVARPNQPSKTDQRNIPLLSNPTSWPPMENKPYPDMELYNQDGKLTRLSNMRGKVIVVQPVAMSCPMSQAYSGANKPEMIPFKLCFPNTSCKDFGQRLFDYTGICMDSPELVFVQILLYNMRNEPPTIDDCKQWAKHFDFRTSRNQYVLLGTPEMTAKSKMLIPGFHLIDRSFTLCSDSTGLIPKRSLYNHFFPTLQRLLPTVTADLSSPPVH